MNCKVVCCFCMPPPPAPSTHHHTQHPPPPPAPSTHHHTQQPTYCLIHKAPKQRDDSCLPSKLVIVAIPRVKSPVVVVIVVVVVVAVPRISAHTSKLMAKCFVCCFVFMFWLSPVYLDIHNYSHLSTCNDAKFSIITAL